MSSRSRAVAVRHDGNPELCARSSARGGRPRRRRVSCRTAAWRSTAWASPPRTLRRASGLDRSALDALEVPHHVVAAAPEEVVEADVLPIQLLVHGVTGRDPAGSAPSRDAPSAARRRRSSRSRRAAAPAATAPNIAEPSAGTCPEAATANSRPVTSAKICIRSLFRSGRPPQATIPVDGDAGRLEGVDDHARAERRRLDQRAVDLRRPRRERHPDEQAAEIGVDEHGAVPVPPVEREQPALARVAASPPPLREPRARSRRCGGRAREPRAGRRSRRTRRRCRRPPTGRPRSRTARARSPSSTTPHIPSTVASSSPRSMWQMLVPMIATIVPGSVTVTAGTETCASTLATATAVPGTRPVHAAARSLRPPARLADRHDLPRHLLVDRRARTAGRAPRSTRPPGSRRASTTSPCSRRCRCCASRRR